MKKIILPILSLLVIMSSCDDTTEGLGTSLIDINDKIDVTSATFDVASQSLVTEEIFSRSSTGYLGTIKDPETSTYVTSNFLTQFHTLDNYQFPQADSIVSKIDGKVIADSVEIRVFYDSSYGDSLASMKCCVHELAKPLEESVPYSSAFSPVEEGYVRVDGIHKQKSYTLSDLTISNKDRWNNTPNIRITLNEPYTDKDGNSYNNYGTYVMHKYYENPENFKNSYKFTHNVCPGFFVESMAGAGNMAYINLTQLNVYFRYQTGDSIYSGVATFAGTEEVMQNTTIKQDYKKLEDLANDRECTYLKTPAGIYTCLTLPVDDILKDHEQDTINTARITLLRENNHSDNVYSLPIPKTLLMVPVDSVDTFFANGEVADYRNTFLTTFSSSGNSYTFGNIASLIRNIGNAKSVYMKNHPGKTDAEYEALYPNWNKVILVPVQASYANIGQSQVLTRVANDMSLASTRLLGGKNNPTAIKMSVIYSKFKAK